MSDEKRTEITEIHRKKPSSWGWIFPGIIGLILAKTLGVIGALVTIFSYFWLQPRIGTLSSILLSTVFGVVAGVVSAMLLLKSV